MWVDMTDCFGGETGERAPLAMEPPAESCRRRPGVIGEASSDGEPVGTVSG